MNIAEIDIFRGGGTIIFTIIDDVLAGQYRLQTPFQGLPQPLFLQRKTTCFWLKRGKGGVGKTDFLAR